MSIVAHGPLVILRYLHFLWAFAKILPKPVRYTVNVTWDIHIEFIKYNNDDNENISISLLTIWANGAALIRMKFGVNTGGRGTHSAHTLRPPSLAYTGLTRRGSEFSLSVQWVRLPSPEACPWSRHWPDRGFPWKCSCENSSENKRGQQVIKKCHSPFFFEFQ